ncbi:M48 family metalloprotease [Ruegeria sp. WL0004]|uniref:M48 family metalloprotease n=1 Tax=Ruegeria marisflavi TaxID=2984152 RepID=A0ABT2WU03_9RHOB|nr:M48 family metalloprotease [Ruegeria sp. WL0004]MCU9839356.1 M48 family metalloprotease [Ruegeria sp. WL0004]
MFTNEEQMKKICATLFGLAALSACGTTYQVTEVSDTHASQAKAIFAQEQNTATAQAGQRLSSSQAVRQFEQVVSRVEPVAERFCREQTADRKDFDCNIVVKVDSKKDYRNAFQTYDENRRPLVIFTLPMIADARNPDELAFVMGHEMGHHLAAHIEKQQQQALAGALILGVAAAYAGSSPYVDPVIARQNVDTAVQLGAEIGNLAFSQTYELESDVIATYITKAAGYDPVKGARFFARPENPKHSNGQLSFWGTHPADEKRIATVLATAERMKQTGASAPQKAERKETPLYSQE